MSWVPGSLHQNVGNMSNGIHILKPSDCSEFKDGYNSRYERTYCGREWADWNQYVTPFNYVQGAFLHYCPECKAAYEPVKDQVWVELRNEMIQLSASGRASDANLRFTYGINYDVFKMVMGDWTKKLPGGKSLDLSPSVTIKLGRRRGSPPTMSEGCVQILRYLYQNTDINIASLARAAGLKRNCLDRALRRKNYKYVQDLPGVSQEAIELKRKAHPNH